VNDIVFIGDELSAAGFRLAGARVHVPDEMETRAVFESAQRDARLLLITAEVAARLPPAMLSRALVGTHPLLLVVPDVRQRQAPPDLVGRVRRLLGMEATP